MTAAFDSAERIADAVLYEGYVLYPYRASSGKNRVRWQFGVVMPPACAARDPSERAALAAECLIERTAAAVIDVRLRFLRVRSRQVEAADQDGFTPIESLTVGERTHVTWDEGLLVSIDLPSMRVADLLGQDYAHGIVVRGEHASEQLRDERHRVLGRIVRRAEALSGAVRIAAEAHGPWARLRLVVENTTGAPAPAAGEPQRAEALRSAFVGAHVLLAASGARFVSLADPPPDAAALAASCRQTGLWPALVGRPGRSDLLLCAPIILSDHPSVAPESPGDLCDATEIDEILTLRIQTLTDEEKRQARATDPRAREIIDRSDTLPPEALLRLHGTSRPATDPAPAPSDFETLLNPPGDVPPEDASVTVGSVRLTRGSHVRLRPARRADPMDMFLAGRAATVAGVYRDVENRTYVAVTVDDDPAADLHEGVGRYFYFYPDELEPADAPALPADSGSAPREVRS